MVVQLVSARNAAMQCYRCAKIGKQTFGGRRENLASANKLSRIYLPLFEALNRHHGEGQQDVTVERVHVHAGSHVLAGMVAAPPGQLGGDRRNLDEQPYAKQITQAPESALPCSALNPDAVPMARDSGRTLPHVWTIVTPESMVATANTLRFPVGVPRPKMSFQCSDSSVLSASVKIMLTGLAGLSERLPVPTNISDIGGYLRPAGRSLDTQRAVSERADDVVEALEAALRLQRWSDNNAVTLRCWVSIRAGLLGVCCIRVARARSAVSGRGKPWVRGFAL